MQLVLPVPCFHVAFLHIYIYHRHSNKWPFPLLQSSRVSKGAKIRNQYNQVPHMTQDTNGKVTNSQLDTPNESQEVSPFPAGDHKAHINRRAQRHSKHKAEKKQKIHKRSTTLEWSEKYFTMRFPTMLHFDKCRLRRACATSF